MLTKALTIITAFALTCSAWPASSPNYQRSHNWSWRAPLLAQVSPTGEPEAPEPPAASQTTNEASPNPASAGKDGETLLGRDSGDTLIESGRRGKPVVPLIKIGGDVELKQGETAEVVVVIGGTARVAGKVQDVVVSIFGNAEISGEVDGEVVSVLGSVKALNGAKIAGDVVAVGGTITQAEGAEINGEKQPFDFLNEEQIAGLKNWLYQCVVKMRPLAPQVGWVWILAGIFFLFYLLVAVLFQRPIAACVDELDRRPATTFMVSIVTMLLLPLIVAMLAATGLGLIVVPFILAAVVLGGIAGKVAILEWLGFKLVRAFGKDLEAKPAFALVIGSLLVCVLYIIPILGIIMFTVLSSWGLGSAVLATLGSFKREQPPRPTQTLEPLPMGMTPGSTVPNGTIPYAAPETGTGPTIAGESPAPTQPPLVMDYNLPKATFWERMGAGLLDLVLVGFLNAIVGGPPLGFILALAYFAGMWAWKRTTVGGIVVGLRVARMDGKPVTFAVALVRALGGAFSMCVLFLGFLWIAWDRDRQGWHDKLAGTIVLRQPRGTPLV